MSISSLMVPLDGSRFAEAALPVAARLARSASARLRVVLAHEPAMAMVPAADIPMVTGPDDEALRADQKGYLAGMAHDLGKIVHRPIDFALIEGLAAPALVTEVEHARPDLVVMATHGRGPLTRFWLGSVADHLIRHLSVPMLLIRPQDGDPVPAVEIRLQRGLVALDRSSGSETILGPAIDLARLTGGHLTLVHVVEPLLGTGSVPPYPVALSEETLEQLRREGQIYLDGVADRLRAEGIAVATRVVIGVGVAPTILHQLESGRYDFVAMSTQGAGGVRRLLLGSVADKVIRGSAQPVLIRRPAEH